MFSRTPDRYFTTIQRQLEAQNGIPTRHSFASQTRVEHVRSTKAKRKLEVEGQICLVFEPRTATVLQVKDSLTEFFSFPSLPLLVCVLSASGIRALVGQPFLVQTAQPAHAFPS
jgi:hypothetical protein